MPMQAAVNHHHKLAGLNTHVMTLPAILRAVTELFSGSLAAVMQLKVDSTVRLYHRPDTT